MKTLYIDIYFLINFTVDLISLHFAAIFSRILVSNKRLIISAFMGAIAACISALLDLPAINLFIFVSTIILASLICANKSGVKGRGVFGIWLIIFLSLVGGIVSFTWNNLETFFSDYLIENDIVNRKMLFFALIALLSIGVFKMLIAVLNTGKIEASVDFDIKFLDKSIHGVALVDTGNLALDPLGMKPVFIIKKSLAEKFVSSKIINLTNVDELEKNIKRRIRLIPLTKNGVTHVYVGFVPDDVKVYYNGKTVSIDVTVAIDKEGGEFGGLSALMPFSAISNAIN